jgi:membrane protein implicated in regulation of membrane protease activity
MVTTAYLICLGVGLLFTLVTAFMGHAFGGHEGDVFGSQGHAEAGADGSDGPGVSIFSPTVICSFLAAFGGAGLLLQKIPATQNTLINAPLAALCATGLAGGVLYILRTIFRHTQSNSESHVADLVGKEATVITPIPEHGVGEIAYVQGGSRYTAPARTESGQAVSCAKPVKITRIVGTQFYISEV